MKPKNIMIPCLGYEIAADWYEGSTDAILLVLVGFKSSKANYFNLTGGLVEQTGTSALVIDYTGHGESPFDLDDVSPAQNFIEVIKAFDWLKDTYPDRKINVMGTSYGGFQATQLTKYRKFNDLVLRVPAIYRPNDFYTEWGKMDLDMIRLEYRTNPENFASHPLLKRAAKFEGRTFVVTHEFDTACPPPTTDAFIKAFDSDTWEAKGFKHGLGESDVSDAQIAEYQKQIADWLIG